MDKVRMGIIGGGRISDLNILGYLDHPRCRVVAACDINEDIARRRMKEWGADRYYTDYRKLLADPEIDAVEILSPHRLHHPMVIEAARAGKHVSVQKPMCVTLREAEEMTAACRSAGVKFKVFENFVFYPPYVKARELMAAGEIGEPLSINIKLGSGMGGWWVPLKTWLWRINWEECGGGPAVYDDGFHKLSLARWFFGEIESVKAWVDFSLGVIDMPALITWRYRDNPKLGVWEVTASPGMMCQGTYYGADERVEIVGTDGYIWVTRCTSRLTEIPPLYLYKDGESRAFDDMRDDWGESFHDSGWDFIDSILADRDPFLTGEDGSALMRFWLAILKSYQTGREVGLKEVQS
ncbi:MAG TPA: Gfo/Idh/MocA family oxidoreductase [bacterium]|nr:Gfo/Idh/MocA family oxidoreductase [bacterium]